MTIRVGINGFGRIGRLVLRAALKRDPWFDGPAWNAAAQQPMGVQRGG